MTTIMENRLVTDKVKTLLADYPLYSQDAKQKDAVCHCVFRIGHIRWYILEGQAEGDDFTFYGIVLGLFETEYGYVSANEMQSIKIDASKKGWGTLQVEPDLQFEPCKLSEIDDDELQNFLRMLYNEK